MDIALRANPRDAGCRHAARRYAGAVYMCARWSGAAARALFEMGWGIGILDSENRKFLLEIPKFLANSRGGFPEIPGNSMES
jgi:hypothetical protein